MGLPEQSHGGGEGARCGNPGAELGGARVEEQQERPWGKQEAAREASKGTGQRKARRPL